MSVIYPRSGSAHIQACNFTTICRRNTDEYDRKGARERASRNMTTMALFSAPRIFEIKIKHDEWVSEGCLHQRWYPVQFCTNCIAAQSKNRCSHFTNSLHFKPEQLLETGEVCVVELGTKSQYDDIYGSFDLDGFLSRDKGYFK